MRLHNIFQIKSGKASANDSLRESISIRLFRFGVAVACVGMTLMTGVAPGFTQDAWVGGEAGSERPFTVRFSANTRGNITIIGNSQLSCLGDDNSIGGQTTCVDARARIGTNYNNNDFYLRQLDVDGVSTTFNSTTADFTLPPTATVLYAGLYWGAFSDPAIDPEPGLNPNRGTVLFSTPTSGGYVPITADILNDIEILYQGNAYQGVADVTALVRSGGGGTYGVANLQALEGPIYGQNRYAGWSMVVVYQDSTQPQRNMVVYDGFLFDSPSSTNIVIPLSGFLTPPFTPVNTAIGLMVYDGDPLGSGQDALLLNNTSIFNTLNPSGNVYNSTITRGDQYVMDRVHNYSNTFGIDVDLLNVTNVLNTSTTTATLVISGSQKVLPGLVTFATDIFRPTMLPSITVSDLNGGEVNPNDILEFTVIVTNTGDLPADQVVLEAPVSPFVTFVSGSLAVLESPVASQVGAQSDAVGDDYAELEGNKVVYRLGTGASGPGQLGGTFAVGNTAKVRFRMRVRDSAANGDVISESIVAKFVANTSNGTFPLSDTDKVVRTVVHPDIGISLAVSPTVVSASDYVIFTVRVANIGLQTGTNATANLILPPPLIYQSVTGISGAPGWNCSHNTVLTCTAPTLASGAVSTITVSARVSAGFASGTLQSSATALISPEWVTTNNHVQNLLTVRPRLVYLPLLRRE
jgi:uncharacterized repeat protein (TIGR01451 family)